MTADVDLHEALTKLTPSMDWWRWTIEVDAEDHWWLTHDGRRTQRRPWRPADEADVLVVAALLYSLNDAGEVPIEGRYLAGAQQARMTEAQLRGTLNRQAYYLFMRLRTGRDPMAASGDWRSGWTP